MDLPPLERELYELREENRRLKGLLELREDRTELERFQIQSRNKLMGIFGAFVAVLAVFAIIAYAEHAEIKQEQQTIIKLKKGAIILPNDSSDQ